MFWLGLLIGFSLIALIGAVGIYFSRKVIHEIIMKSIGW